MCMLMCMCMLNRRTQILFSKDYWNKLNKKAKAQNTSIGDIVRKAVERDFEMEKELEQRKRVIEDIKRIRPAPFKGRIDYKALINYGRK